MKPGKSRLAAFLEPGEVDTVVIDAVDDLVVHCRNRFRLQDLVRALPQFSLMSNRSSLPASIIKVGIFSLLASARASYSRKRARCGVPGRREKTSPSIP